MFGEGGKVGFGNSDPQKVGYDRMWRPARDLELCPISNDEVQSPIRFPSLLSLDLGFKVL